MVKLLRCNYGKLLVHKYSSLNSCVRKTEIKFLLLLMLTALPLCCLSSTAVQHVLGGQWFSKMDLGESNDHPMSEWKTRVCV